MGVWVERGAQCGGGTMGIPSAAAPGDGSSGSLRADAIRAVGPVPKMLWGGSANGLGAAMPVMLGGSRLRRLRYGLRGIRKSFGGSPNSDPVAAALRLLLVLRRDAVNEGPSRSAAMATPPTGGHGGTSPPVAVSPSSGAAFSAGIPTMPRGSAPSGASPSSPGFRIGFCSADCSTVGQNGSNGAAPRRPRLPPRAPRSSGAAVGLRRALRICSSVGSGRSPRPRL